MKNRAGLLKTLMRFDRCSKMFLTRMANHSTGMLASVDREELAQTSRQIAEVQLNMMKLSRELAFVSRQIRALAAGRHCQDVTARGKRRALSVPDKVTGIEAEQRLAFAAVSTEYGAVVLRVPRDGSGVWPEEEYGRFETWTQAQSFARLLNQRHGLDPVDAQHIVASAALAAAKPAKQKT